MEINKAIIKKSEVNVYSLKVLGYSARLRRADDMEFQSERIKIDDKWAEEIFHTAVHFIREGVRCMLQPNLKLMTMEIVISDAMLGDTPMAAILSRPMTAVEAFEFAQNQKVLPD